MIALRSICLALVFGTVAGAATAADLPRRTDPYAPAAPVYAPQRNWTGAYVGAHLGGGFGKGGSVSTSGFVGGVQAGYNAQFDKFVVGGEADITASGVENKTWNEKVKNTWLASGRVRAGYLVDPNILVYGTGGLAGGSVTVQNVKGKVSDRNAGFVLGAGGEYMMSPNVTLRGEYLYYDIGKVDVPGTAGALKIDNHVNVLRAGVNYKF